MGPGGTRTEVPSRVASSILNSVRQHPDTLVSGAPNRVFGYEIANLSKNSLQRLKSNLSSAIEEAERRDWIHRNVARIARVPSPTPNNAAH